MSDCKYLFTVETLYQHKLEKCFLFVSEAKSSMFVQTLHAEMVGQELRTNQTGHWVRFYNCLSLI